MFLLSRTGIENLTNLVMCGDQIEKSQPKFQLFVFILIS